VLLYRHIAECDNDVEFVQKLKSFDKLPMNSLDASRESLGSLIGSSTEEKLGRRNMMYCDDCGSKQCMHLKHSAPLALPSSLCISLNARFDKITGEKDKRKVTMHDQFHTLHFNITPIMLIVEVAVPLDFDVTNQNGDKTKYFLRAVVLHTGTITLILALILSMASLCC
jgi:ubiquitin C-terminal hydrolase